jgi:hypothetical protein
MCTVTFIPTPAGVLITSNRDEGRDRGLAHPPQVHTTGDTGLIYPKDPDAGGSWIVLKENAEAAVLLNGAFVRHHRKPSYRKSRGLVLLEIMEAAVPLRKFKQADLREIEPFTLILFSRRRLWECRWDGSRKTKRILDAAHPHIWSSATLYSDSVARQREHWFGEWLSRHSTPDSGAVLEFHRTAGSNDPGNALVMNRDNRLFTVSVTSIVLTPAAGRMVYSDLRTGAEHVTGFPRKKAKENGSFTGQWKRFWTRLTHWEYWPGLFIYGPLYIYWLWLSLKARSFFWFSAANPGIENAGFTNERKSSIYRLLPAGAYPRTRLFPAGADTTCLIRQLQKEGLSFPLIAKPDIGERGSGVKLLRSPAEMAQYAHRSPVDFLVQEYIPYEHEVGIFYSRLPGESRGQITGMVGKEFLSVRGDGRSSIHELIRRSDRAALQSNALQQEYGDFLETILADATDFTLVPYGNHCRGAKFLDQTARITPELTRAIDTLCQQIPGFYFGRLDIKFADWDSLAQGINFTLIELNGAGSEPTHIYDPAHSVFFAWKEIIRHWRLLYKTSRLNAKVYPLMSTQEGLAMIRAHRQHNQLLRSA